VERFWRPAAGWALRGVAALARRLGARLEPGEDAGGDRPRLVLRDGARVGHYPDDVVGAVAAQIKQRGIVLRRRQLLFEEGDLAVLLGELLLGGITGPVGDGAAASRLSIEVRIQEDLAEPVGSGCTKMKRP